MLFCFNIVTHSSPARLEENVKLTAPILLATARAIAAALSVETSKPAWWIILVKKMVAPMFVPAMLHRMTPIMPTSQIAGNILPPEAMANHLPKISIHPFLVNASIRINCENAKGIRPRGSRGRAVKNVGKCLVRELYLWVILASGGKPNAEEVRWVSEV